MIATWMVYAVAVGALMAAAAWVLERGARPHGVPVRWIWAAAVAASLLVPLAGALRTVAGAPSPGDAIAVSPAATDPTAGADPGASAAAQAPSLLDRAAAALVSLRSRTPDLPALPSAWDPMAMVVWTLMSAGVAGALARARLELRRRSRSEWTASRLDGRDVLLSPDVGPAVVGVLRPAIVVPRWAAELPAAERELILRHEEEHRRAGDAPLLLAALLALVLLPWSLPLWWQVRRLRLAVELDCDRRVMLRTPDLRRYALLLVEMSRKGALTRAGALALAHPAPFLERRIRTMTERAKPRIPRSAASMVMAVALMTLAAWLERPEARAETVDLSEMVMEHLVDAHEAEAEAPREPATQEVRRPGLISGRVTDAVSGAPIADVQVYLVGVSIGAITRQNGAYVMINVPAGTYRIRAERIGLGTVTKEVTVVDEAGTEVRFEMTPQSIGLDEIVVPGAPPAGASPSSDGRIRLTGQVLDAETGAPVPSAQVVVVGANLGAITREDGTFLILNPPEGEHVVRIQRIGIATMEQPVTLRPGQVTSVHFRTRPEPVTLQETGSRAGVQATGTPARAAATARVTGTVTDAATGMPLPDVELHLVGTRIGAISRQNGQYILLNVPPGTYELRAEGRGVDTASRQISVTAGAVAQVGFELRVR